MATITHLRLALSQRRLRRQMAQPVRLAEVVPMPARAVRAVRDRMSWLEIIVTTLAVIGWAFLCVVTL